MTPGQLSNWVRVAGTGDTIAYYSGTRPVPPDLFATALQYYREGRVMLYQKRGQWFIRKISSRAKRFLDYVSSLTPTPPRVLEA